MKEETIKILDKATDCLQSAQVLFETQHFEAAINRAYYCMFDAVQALFCEQDLYVKTHQGTNSKFNQLYIKTDLLPKELSQDFTKIFELRQVSDYDFETTLTQEDAQMAIECANKFLHAIQNYLQ
jgi:uncharacterized protein (UPF0332 family)